MTKPGSVLISGWCLLLVPMVAVHGSGRHARQLGVNVCTTESGSTGQCVELPNCSELNQLLSQVKRGQLPSSALGRLRKETFKCQFAGRRPFVCCQTTSRTATVTPSVVTQQPLTQRPITQRPLIQRPITPPPLTQRPITQPPTNPPVRSPLVNLPDASVCGQRTFGARVFGGGDAEIGAWPWAASIGYLVPGRSGLQWRCGGTLITTRHVLTAAHCIVKLPKESGSPEMVRLGEVDFDRNPDCLADNPTVCADPHIDVPIASIRGHPNYQGRSNNAFADDIGLVELSRNVPVTDFVRPICLPRDLNFLASRSDTASGVQAFIAGWGRSDEFPNEMTPRLQEARIQLREPSACLNLFVEIRGSLGDRLCAGAGDGTDTCRGDSGGPLMMPTATGRNWYLTGVTSFGSRRCGRNPAVYTRVHKYIDWIQSNLLVSG